MDFRCEREQFVSLYSFGPVLQTFEAFVRFCCDSSKIPRII